MTREDLDNVFLKMVEMYEGQPERIQHFTKVHSYAAYIGRQEKLDEKTMFILETAAYTHDIGIKRRRSCITRQTAGSSRSLALARRRPCSRSSGFRRISSRESNI